MSWVWETELMPPYGGDTSDWVEVLHLKKSWIAVDGRIDRNYKISFAWISRAAKRKWILSFADTKELKTFSTLKAAKAYAVAIVTLEN
jgi:hypothetical protein